MNKQIVKKAVKAVKASCKNRKVSKRLLKNVVKEIERDLILPDLSLTAKSRVSCEYIVDKEDGDYISLEIGPRDFSFDVKNGSCTGAGTCIDPYDGAA